MARDWARKKLLKIQMPLGMGPFAYNPSAWEAKAEHCKFEASLGYIKNWANLGLYNQFLLLRKEGVNVQG